MKVKINRNNTNWLSYLGITSIISGFIFFIGFIVFILDIVYTAVPKQDGAGLGINLICYYYSLIIMIIEVVSCVYFYFNLFYWFLAYKKSINNRRKFNKTFLCIVTPLLILITIDAIIRLVYVMGGISSVGVYRAVAGKPLAAIDFNQTGAIFGNFSPDANYLPIGNFGFNAIFLLVFYAFLFCLSLTFHFKQRKLFISEEKENSNKELRANYRSLEMEKMKKKLSKQKTKDLSKKIKAF